MSFPLRIPDQLKQHLRALRKSCGLTQAQLGALVGVRQARIAEIEAKPGAVSLDQLTKVLAALGSTLHLHRADGADTESSVLPAFGSTLIHIKGDAASRAKRKRTIVRRVM